MNHFKTIKYLIVVFLLLNVFHVFAQIPLLERTVTIHVDNKLPEEVFSSIEKQTGASFSYNSSLVPADKTVSVHAVNRSVREVLDKMFSGRLQYKARGSYIILTRAPEEQKVISGYVENAKGEKVAGASVYDATTLASATTNEYGYYEMKIRRDVPLQLAVSKSNYADTVKALQPAIATLQNIVIEEKKDTAFRHMVSTVRDTVVSKFNNVSDWTVEQFTRNPNVENIHDTLHRAFQASFVPFFGTNGALSGNVTSDVSFNILGGYNRGVKRAELGGLFNIDREDVSYVQIGGLGNVVGGKMDGAQIGGLMNIDRGDVRGAQFAGLINFNLAEMQGGQFAGLINFNRDTVQAGQFAGLLNINGASSAGAQFAGLINFQLGNYKGAQVAGLMNINAKEIDGLQLAGLVNIAGKVKGSQIGFLNIADSLSGLPLGMLSFVNKGYHKIELSYDELQYSNLALRTGVHHFYNILTVGAKTDFNTDTVDWTFGYGLGCAPRLTERLFLNFDVTGNQIVHGNWKDELNMLNKLYVGAEYQVAKKFSVTAGLTLNAYLTEITTRPLVNSDLHPHIVYDREWDDRYKLESWIGWKVGVRFL